MITPGPDQSILEIIGPFGSVRELALERLHPSLVVYVSRQRYLEKLLIGGFKFLGKDLDYGKIRGHRGSPEKEMRTLCGSESTVRHALRDTSPFDESLSHLIPKGPQELLGNSASDYKLMNPEVLITSRKEANSPSCHHSA